GRAAIYASPGVGDDRVQGGQDDSNELQLDRHRSPLKKLQAARSKSVGQPAGGGAYRPLASFQANGTIRRSSFCHPRCPLFSKYSATSLRMYSGIFGECRSPESVRTSSTESSCTTSRALQRSSIV